MSTTHPVFAALAEAFSYPAPGRLAELRGLSSGMPEGHGEGRVCPRSCEGSSR